MSTTSYPADRNVTNYSNLACHKQDSVRVQRSNFPNKNKSHEPNNLFLAQFSLMSIVLLFILLDRKAF